MYADVLLLSPPWSVLTYALPDAFPVDIWQKGLRLVVPLGKGKNRVGILLKCRQESGLKEGIECRQIIWPLENKPLLDEEILELADDLGRRQGMEQGQILSYILPSGLFSLAIRIEERVDGRLLRYSLKDVACLSEQEYANLAYKFGTGQALVHVSEKDRRDSELIGLEIDPPWPLRPAAVRRKKLLDYLFEQGSVSRRQITAALGPCSDVISALMRQGYISIKNDGDAERESKNLLPPAPLAFELNREQKEALQDLGKDLQSGKASCSLLYGVTGSGKTAIYIELARQCLQSGRNVLLLAPEVALALKLNRDISLALPHFSHFLYHGYQTQNKREKLFRALAVQKEPCMVIGTRSALFLPLARPACIILDEEHDGSYKQDENFGYHAKEVAWFKTLKNNGLLVLGSATPDIKTFNAARAGRLKMLTMKNRVGGTVMPPIELVNIGAKCGQAAHGSLAATAEGISLLAEESENALRQCLERGEQAVILLNRRGYAPMIYCVECGKVMRCPNCEIGLSYHKSLGKLVCHYCGYSIPWPSPCKICGKASWLAIGEGTERLAERLEVMAGQPVLRLDRDSARRQGRMEDILERFGRGESPFLVGTQMLSKGHHFPNVTLVIVADGDIGLNLPDYRAAERTFQLLVQSAGRAGRGSKPGRVIIQTRDLNHYCWKYVTSYNYEGFYEEELARRKRSLYPPFTKLAILRVSYAQNESSGRDDLLNLAQNMREQAKLYAVRMLGPAPAGLAMLRGRKRFQFMLKGNDWNSIRQVYFQARKIVGHSCLRIFLDIDPMNMF